MPVKIYLVRHGETYFNKGGIVEGQLDKNLSESGLKQIKLIGGWFYNHR